ncbi:MAG: WG repeat-containing protein, partial [Ruminiclostridium sp.]|nr:WG repeat-containing protein [Ruminiclostridium sp.]
AANGLARVQSGKKWGYIKSDGEYAIELRFDYAESFDGEGTACVAVDCLTDGRGLQLGGKWGFITEDGSYLIEPCYDWANGFAEDGFARVILDGKRGYVSRTGDFTPDP